MKKAMSALAIVLLGALNVCGVTATVNVAPFDSAAIESLTLKLPESTTPSIYTTAQQITFTSRSSFTITLKVKTGYRNDAHMTVTQNEDGRPKSTTVVNSGTLVTPSYPGVVITDLTATLITNKVSLSAEGGMVGSSYVMMPYGTSYGTKLPTATRTGYTFAGWYTAKTGGTKIESTTVERETADHTLYVHWTANAYTVTFNPNGGTVDPKSKSVTYDGDYGDLPTPEKTGYDFANWTNRTGSVITPSTKYRLDADETLYASWSAQQYTIRYHANFGSDVVTTQSFPYGGTTTLKSTEGRQGYTFKGWADSPSAGSAKYAGDQSVDTASLIYDSNRTADLYAVWDARPYMVTLKANGGVGVDQTQERRVDDGLALAANPAFVREGYVLKGWGKNSSDKDVVFADGTTENLSDSDITLYALWEPIVYTIGFDKADDKATGTMADVEMLYGAVTNLPACAFSKEGYEFSGWTNAVGALYGAGAVVSNLTATANARVVLFASWRPETYVVTLDAGEGLFVTNGLARFDIRVTMDEPYTALADMAMTNATPKRTFQEWRYLKDGAWTVAPTNGLVPAKSAGVTNLVAHWVKDDPIARALDAEALDFTSSPEWTVCASAEAVGGTCVAATTGPQIGTTWMPLKLTVVGPGTLSFRWKVSSTEDAWLPKSTYPFYESFEMIMLYKNKEQGEDFKYALTSTPSRWGWGLDGEWEEAIEGTIGWTNMSYVVEAAENETNTLAWTFYVQNDGGRENLLIGTGYVDHVVWTPASEKQETATHRVPYAWLKENFTAAATMTEDELETLAESASPNGKCWPDGTPVHVWEDYAAGTDPQNKTDVFKTLITMEKGVPSVSWTPNLGAERTYRVLGATSLKGPWTEDADPASGDFRFFKVRIVYP